MPDPRVGLPNVGYNPFTIQGRFPYLFGFLLFVGRSPCLGDSGENMSLPLSYLSWCIFFIFCCGVAVRLAFRPFSGENYSTGSYKLVVSVGGGEFRSSYACVLNKNLHCFKSWYSLFPWGANWLWAIHQLIALMIVPHSLAFNFMLFSLQLSYPF